MKRLAQIVHAVRVGVWIALLVLIPLGILSVLIVNFPSHWTEYIQFIVGIGLVVIIMFVGSVIFTWAEEHK